MDSEKREIYNKLGPDAAASKAPFDENSVLFEVRDAFALPTMTASPLRLSVPEGRRLPHRNSRDQSSRNSLERPNRAIVLRVCGPLG